jgi:hypothetical protein
MELSDDSVMFLRPDGRRGGAGPVLNGDGYRTLQCPSAVMWMICSGYRKNPVFSSGKKRDAGVKVPSASNAPLPSFSIERGERGQAT